MDPTRATATEISEAIRRREVSSREVLDALVARVEAVNPGVNAVVAVDVERAQAAAAAADEATARGDERGPLHGLPMTVKDVWETEGLVTTAGAPELKDHVPTTDVLVARLKQAGAIVFGKTNTPLYAGDFQTYNEVYGVTNNPWDPTRTTGGSSGGSAAAVATGMSPLELGSDIGGSIRNPAHFTGVYGMKPSHGVVPSRGHIPGPPGSLVEADVNCNGPLARSIDDLEAGLSVLAGPVPEEAVGWRLELDAGPPIGELSELRVATVFHDGRDVLPVARAVTANLERFAEGLAGAGAKVEEVALPVPLAAGLRSWVDMVLPIIGSAFSDEEFDGFTALDVLPSDDPTIASGKALVSRFRTWTRANQRRQIERAAWAEFFTRYDVVLAPVMPTTAFPHDTEGDVTSRVLDVDGQAVAHMFAVAWCGAIGSVLLPVVTLPTGPASDGLPVGVQVIGPYLSDLRLLEIARRLDEAAGPGFAPPP